MELRKAKNIEIGIKHLENLKDLVIRPADKREVIVIQTKEAYKVELRRQILIADKHPMQVLPTQPKFTYRIAPTS